MADRVDSTIKERAAGKKAGQTLSAPGGYLAALARNGVYATFDSECNEGAEHRYAEHKYIEVVTELEGLGASLIGGNKRELGTLFRVFF